jgi:anti-sigma B factor antagonist
MRLFVRSIDFVEKAVSVEVDRPIGPSGLERLQGLLGCCADLGFSSVELRHPARASSALHGMIEEIGRTRSLPAVILAGEEAGTPAPPDPLRAGRAAGRRESGERVEYRLVLSDLSTVIEDVSAAVLIAGIALWLDERTLARLRLCLYELTANTVEHADFHGRSPEIRIGVVAANGRVSVDYADNAEEFPTAASRAVDIEERMRTKSKRGLGLFLLGRMASGLGYERRAGWNHTTFAITRTSHFAYELHRRLDMNELNISVDRTESRDIGVLKPLGSINSSTVAKLDDSINELVHEGRTTIVLDMSETNFISSSGVGLLVGTVQTLREKNGDLVLMNLPKLVNDIFDVLNIKMHFRIIDGLDQLKAGSKR